VVETTSLGYRASRLFHHSLRQELHPVLQNDINYYYNNNYNHNSYNYNRVTKYCAISQINH